LGYDERPLRISQKLKEAKQNPVFVLKHVKDNKPFVPPSAYSHPRPAPKPYVEEQQSQQYNGRFGAGKTSLNEKRTATVDPKTAITSGRVGFEVVIPVMSSSISTPSSLSGSPKRSASKKPTEYTNELGLDNAVVNAIFSINNGTQNP
jgi:hypothetical protein